MRRLGLPGLAALICLQACAPGTPGRTLVQVVPGQPGAQIAVTYDQGAAAVVEVTDPAGIGTAELAISGPIPQSILLRFRLQGLELVEVAYGQITVTASLSSATGHAVSEAVRLSAGATETPLTADSPYWMAFSVQPARGSPAIIPLKQGAIEVRLPRDFYSSGERSVEIRWIDFLR